MVLGPVAALIVLVTLAAVLCVSGLAKAREPRATRDAFDALRVPAAVPADPAARALPWVELVLAAGLLLLPAPWLVVAAGGVLVLMLVYTVLIARALGWDEPVSCSCFGSIGSHDVDRLTLGRNILLATLSAVAVWFAADGGSAPAATADLTGPGWWALLAAAAAAAVAVLVAGVRTPTSTSAGVDGDFEDYERQRIPYGVLRMHDGTTASLLELSRTQARLIVILNAGCSPCVRTAERLDEWARLLAPAVGVVAVYADEASAREPLGHSPELGAFEPERNVRQVFGVVTPSAILLGADRYLAGGPVEGEDEVVELVEEVLAELGVHQDAP